MISIFLAGLFKYFSQTPCVCGEDLLYSTVVHNFKAWILNNKEFTSELSRRLGYTLKDTSELVTSLLSDMTRQLEEGNVISIQGFGTFEVKKKAERISVNPTTKQRMLVPPKLVLTYKPSTLLKDKFK